MQANPFRSLVARRISAPMLALLAISLTRAADYQSAVLNDGPQAYYRFNDDTSRSLINKNSGSLGAAGNATNDLHHDRMIPKTRIGKEIPFRMEGTRALGWQN